MFQESNSASLHQEAVQDWSNEVKKMMTLMRMVFNQEQKEKYLSTVMEQVRLTFVMFIPSLPAV